MNGKSILIGIVAAAFFSLAASHRFLDSAHAIGTIKKGGGSARHPALLDKGRDSYTLIATAGVIPPYHGNARVVLEGDPALTATFHNSEPAVDLRMKRQPEFRDNTYYDLRARDRIALWVKIKRNQLPDVRQNEIAAAQVTRPGAEQQCSQCDPETGDTAAKATGNGWRGRGAGALPVKGLAVAFYDTATNEPLLKIPIRFTGGAGGGDNGH